MKAVINLPSTSLTRMKTLRRKSTFSARYTPVSEIGGMSKQSQSGVVYMHTTESLYLQPAMGFSESCDQLKLQ